MRLTGNARRPWDTQGDIMGSKPRWARCGGLCFQPGSLECKRLVTHNLTPHGDPVRVHISSADGYYDASAGLGYPCPAVSSRFDASDHQPERSIPGFPAMPEHLMPPARTGPYTQNADGSPALCDRDLMCVTANLLAQSPRGLVSCTAETFLETIHLAPRAMLLTRPGEPERALYFPSYRAQPSPCGNILVDIRPYGPCSQFQQDELDRRFHQRDPHCPCLQAGAL